MLAKVLACPVKLMFSYIDNSSSPEFIQFDVVDFAEKVEFDRKNREDAIQKYAQQFASALETECAKAPFQWFNFYDFWLPCDKEKHE
jgi:predicted LPLAT superfamily acyltransferase